MKLHSSVRRSFSDIFKRGFATEICGAPPKKGLVLGVYEGCEPGELKMTNTAAKFDEDNRHKLTELLRGVQIHKGNAQVFGNIGDDFYSVAVAGLGPESVGLNQAEALDECKENIRTAAGIGARALQDQGIGGIFVEGFTNSEAAAEGATLAVWRYQELKNSENILTPSKVELFDEYDREGWQRGVIKAEAQNLARRLEEVPANLMTPMVFSQSVIEALCPCGVQVEMKDKDWLDSNRFTAFLNVARGSCHMPVFIELLYCGGHVDEKPVVLIGKGATFETGGMCLKKCKGMALSRGDLAGAAVIVGVFKAAAMMNLPINLVGLLPVYEHMISGAAIKPGDVVMALNGKTIRVDDTKNDGRVVVSDVLSFCNIYKPCLIMNLATSTRALFKGIGSLPTGVFSTSEVVWREVNRAAALTGDRVWRFPLWKTFHSRVTDFVGVDVHNVGKGVGGEPCLGAAFLMEFAPECVDLIHFDITGTGLLSTGIGMPYLRKGVMTGRPVRTVVQFLYQLACPHTDAEDC